MLLSRALATRGGGEGGDFSVGPERDSGQGLSPSNCLVSPLISHAYTCKISLKMTQIELQALPCYCATLRQAARAATALYEAVLDDSGVPLTQLTALQVMMRCPNLMTTELAEIIGIDQTTATRTLALIKKAGLARTTLADDRRERRWVLSAEGERKMRRLMTKWEKAQATFEARLGSAHAAALKQSAYLAARKLASA
jgi:DNA-binding MarR family transcriptional regulator